VWTVEWFWRGILKLKTLSLNLTYSPSIIWSRKVIPTTLLFFDCLRKSQSCFAVQIGLVLFCFTLRETNKCVQLAHCGFLASFFISIVEHIVPYLNSLLMYDVGVSFSRLLFFYN
jgi:hypothetical protein